ncbi:hypothetical protein GCM10008022_11380 [Paenibacillus hunanensis]|nr:hypothetical protein GCM10008022_11380 [Paenibacillus hunanensis]
MFVLFTNPYIIVDRSSPYKKKQALHIPLKGREPAFLFVISLAVSHTISSSAYANGSRNAYCNLDKKLPSTLHRTLVYPEQFTRNDM